MQNGVRSLLRPAPTYVAAKFALDLVSAHGPICEARGVVNLARDPLAVREDRGHAGWHCSTHARRKGGIFGDRDLLHEGEDGRVAKLVRCEGFIGDVAIEHRTCGDIGKAVVGGLTGLWRPLLRLASCPLIAPACGRDLDRRDAVERA